MSERKVLMLWLGWAHKVTMCREGVHLYNINLLSSLLRHYDIDLEVCLFGCNDKEFKLAYDELLKNYGKRIRINYIKKNFVMNLSSNRFIRTCVRMLKINKLAAAIVHGLYYKFHAGNKVDTKDKVILVPMIYLTEALALKGAKILILHDLFPVVFQNYEPSWKKVAHLLLNGGESFAKQGTTFIAPSEFIRREHGLKYIKNLKEDKIIRVYSPINIPHDIENNIIPKGKLFKHFAIPSNAVYFIYPSQNRPYKNIIGLLKAFNEVLKYENCYLLLNCLLEMVPEVDLYIKEHNLRDKIILLGNLSNEELYSLYKYSAAAVIPTRGEAGFPWQAMEGLYMKTPVIVTNIPVTLERLKFMGFDSDNSGLLLFDPDNIDLLAQHMVYALHNREKVVKSQAAVREKLMEYTWDDVAKEYYKLIEKIS